MKEILSTSDPAELTFLKSIFQSAGIPIFVFDEMLSSTLGGFGDGFAPCRIMVVDSDYEDALDLLDDLDELMEQGGLEADEH